MSNIYLAHKEALIGKVFYNNLLAKKGYVHVYFPPYATEDPSAYERRYKIAIPIAKSIVNRLANILVKDTVISSKTPEIQARLELLDESLKFSELYRKMIVNTLVTGDNLFVIRPGPELDVWTGEYITFESGVGYTYILKDEVIYPILEEPKDKDVVFTIYVDDVSWGGFVHEYGFNPSVLTKNIDLYEDDIYGKSYILRFDDLIVRYNGVFSNMYNAAVIFQNIWTTNRSIDNPEEPTVLVPYRINYLGPDGKLEQAARQLNFEPEKELLDRLEHQITLASGVPGELSGLKEAGKLPSGRALQILMVPLVELIDRMDNTFLPSFTELVEKIVKMNYISEGTVPPTEIQLDVQTDNTVFPEESDEVIDRIERLKRIMPTLLTEETIKIMLEPFIDFVEEETE